MRMVVGLASISTALMVAACSASVPEADLKEQARVATASALNLDAAIAAIEITTVERGATNSSWVAHYDGTILSCSGNEKFQLPDCRVNPATASN